MAGCALSRSGGDRCRYKGTLRAKSPFRYYGPDPQFESRQFETELAAFIGVSYCVAVSNGTTALQVALSALDVGPGDEVIMPGYFWVSTVGAVVRNGAIPVLADVDKSFYLDPDDLERKITERTKLVIAVPMGGVIGQISKIADICSNRGIKLLEIVLRQPGPLSLVKWPVPLVISRFCHFRSIKTSMQEREERCS